MTQYFELYSQITGWLVDNELEIMCKAAVFASSEVLSRHIPVGTKQKHKKSVSTIASGPGFKHKAF